VPRAGLRFDVVVLGGGAAGCVLAARLSDQPDRSVCLVEAGPDYGHFDDGAWPPDLCDARSLAFSHAWEADPGHDRSQLRARVIGGCSAHNACAAIRGHPSDYEWGDTWTWTTMEPYLERVERQLGVHVPDEDELSPWQRAFLEAARELEPFEAGPHPVNTRGAVRWHAGFAYLDEARGRANLTILDRAVADRVLRAGGHVTHARVVRDGERLDLEAGAVVLACGAYGSPLVLQRSGIGPAEELDRLGVPVVADLSVGEGLIDHAGAGMAWRPTPELEHDMDAFAAERPVFMGQVTVYAQSTSCEPEDCWDVFLFPAVEPAAPPHGWDVSAAAFAMKPRSRGRVRARTLEPERPPEIAHGFLNDPGDALPIVEGAYLLRGIAESEQMRRYVDRELRPGPRAYLDRYVPDAVRGFFHPVGTCALGPVCDRDGRVHGFDNLIVADASFVPDIPRANTHLTTLAVAERLAERV
jgi:choline dehydrogenase